MHDSARGRNIVVGIKVGICSIQTYMGSYSSEVANLSLAWRFGFRVRPKSINDEAAEIEAASCVALCMTIVRPIITIQDVCCTKNEQITQSPAAFLGNQGVNGT